MKGFEEFDPTALRADALRAAARAYSEAVVKARAAYKAHQKNSELDEYDPKSTKTENRLYLAERNRDDRLDDLRVAALMLAGGKAAEIGKELMSLNKRYRKDRHV